MEMSEEERDEQAVSFIASLTKQTMQFLDKEVLDAFKVGFIYNDEMYELSLTNKTNKKIGWFKRLFGVRHRRRLNVKVRKDEKLMDNFNKIVKED